MNSNLLNLTENSHKQVLNLIRLNKEISGAELSRLTNLRPSTILYILRSLDEKGLIEISGTGESTTKGGKKPTLWKLKPDLGFVIGMEVIVNKIRIAIAGLNGTFYAKNEYVPNSRLTEKNIVEEILIALKDTIQKESIAIDSIIGVGVAASGLVDGKNGIVRYSVTTGLENFPLKVKLESKLSAKFTIVNDANAGAMDVKWYTEPTQVLPENIVYITYNQGAKNLGAGLIIHNTLYQGVSGAAGEIFHQLPKVSTVIERGIKKLGTDHLLLKEYPNHEEIKLGEIMKLSEKGCQISTFVIEEICKLISDEIARIIAFVNPHLVVIGGDITMQEGLVKKYIIPYAHEKTTTYLKQGYYMPEIRFSQFGKFSVAAGATAIVLSEIIES